ncbi:MAG: DUF2752 domain-containing protein [Planctomycetaceae bacterium]|jgi:hypothetical protein|nr:DUF2752 domain-containing protein [Planctomycetaceae bacterium]
MSQPEPPQKIPQPPEMFPSMKPRQRSFFAVGAVVLLLTGGLLFYKHPADYGFIPSCPFHTVTGLYCPGCGSMRACHYLLNGHFLWSLRCNPLAMTMLPLIFFLTVRWFWTSFLHRPFPFPYQNALYRGVLVMVILFFLVRNLPLDAFDVLRPPSKMTGSIENSANGG